MVFASRCGAAIKAARADFVLVGRGEVRNLHPVWQASRYCIFN